MATTRLAEKPVITELDGTLRIIVSQEEEFEGDKKDVLYKTTIEAVAEALRKVGIDSSRFDELEYNADTGYLHILYENKDVVSACYIGKFAELDESGIIPEEKLPYFNKSDTVYVNDKPIYGTQFADVTEDGKIYIREDGGGNYLITVSENGNILAVKVVTSIADNLDSTDNESALSARQGNVLGGLIGKLGELLTAAKTNLVEAVNEIYGTIKTHTENNTNPHKVTKVQVGLGNVDNTSDINKPISNAAKTEFESTNKAISDHMGNTSNPHSVTKAQVGLGNAENTADSAKKVLSATKLATERKINGVAFDGSKDITVKDDTKIPTSEKASAGGVATLDEAAKIPYNQIPDDVLIKDEETGTNYTLGISGGKVILKEIS